jgi:phage terminase large subunit
VTINGNDSRQDTQQLEATWQVIGSDRYNSLVGASVAGITFSEWALANPSAWGYISPMLRENNGWAMFVTTPRGKNHAFEMYNYGLKTDGWFAEISNVLDTGAFAEEQLNEIKAEYVALYGGDFGAAQFEQEYMCSFEAAILGSFYGTELSVARSEGRICEVEHDPDLPVMTVWDIGYSDDTVILFVQIIANEVRIIDTYSANGHNLNIMRALFLASLTNIRATGYPTMLKLRRWRRLGGRCMSN